MIGTTASDIVREVSSEMDGGIRIGIETGSRGTINTGNCGGSVDVHDRGQWTRGMAEMGSDAEWVDLIWICVHPLRPFPRPRVVWSEEKLSACALRF